MICLTSVFLALVATQPQTVPSRLAVIQPAPAFQLIDQNGRKVRLSDVRENVLVVGFVFTTCNGTCPATTHQMARVQEELNKRGLLKQGKVRLLTITLDLRRDTPEVLRNYMNLYDLDGGSWTFLTGPPEQVQKTLTAWGMWARPTPNGQLDHPSRVFLVDRQRNIREIYNLGFLRPTWVAEDVVELLK